MNNNKRTKIARVIALLIVAIMVVSSLSYIVFAEEEESYVNDQLDFLKKLIVYVEQEYVEELDEEEIINNIYKGFFESLDPYSVYFPTRDSLDDFVDTVSGEYSGVGIVLTEKNNQCVILSAMPNGPAKAAGILPDDVIWEIDGQDVSQRTTTEIANQLRGEEGTKVTLGVKRNHSNDIIRFELTRKKIQILSVNYEVLENDIGYIQVTSFDNDTGKEFEKALTNLRSQGIKSLILDLRDNGGGYVAEAVKVADMIVPEGPIMFYENKGQFIESEHSDSPQIDIPVAVLANRGSASASEIVIGAIQDTKSGTIIGTRTYGKGSAQTTTNLLNGGGMKITIAHFLTPNKNVIHEVGITPDIIVENGLADAAALDKVGPLAAMLEEKKPSLGDTGLNVYGAQQRLALLGYEDHKITGILDEDTFQAIMAYQASRGLFPYGTLDFTTRNALETETLLLLNNSGLEDLQLKKAIEVLKR
ncbi:MAG: S41 family peptidase [Peptostreptococcales bacterium]|jgi:carboxyl-terminal processing protease